MLGAYKESVPPTRQRSTMSTKQSSAPTRSAITLKGSTNIVTEFFKYAVNTSVALSFPTHLAHVLAAYSFREASIPRMTSTW